jgi:hypothetical protein
MSNKKSNDLIWLSPSEMSAKIERFIEVNKIQAAEGETRLAVCFEGEGGTGKTSIPKQLAQSRGYGYHSLVLSQIEDIGDLVGYPYKSVEMVKKDTNGEKQYQWFSDTMAAIRKDQGWEYTDKTRTQYAEPEWLGKLREGEASILNLDDFTRSDQRFQQAIMQLIQDGQYYSCKLPDNCTIVLTCNPNDEDYIVNEQDLAQSGRYCKFGVRFKIEDWVKWATAHKIDGRCINIMINSYQEMMYSTDPKRKARYKMDVSPRDWSNFFIYCKTIMDLTSTAGLEEVISTGKSYVGERITIFTTALTNKLDKLPSPEEILTKTEKELDKMLLDACGSNKEKGEKRYRAEIASVIMMRFQYYMINRIKTAKDFTKAIEDRVVYLLKSDSIGAENKMNMVSLFHREGGQAFQSILMRSEFRDKVLANLKG